MQTIAEMPEFKLLVAAAGTMNKAFQSIKTGLSEAIAHAKGGSRGLRRQVAILELNLLLG